MNKHSKIKLAIPKIDTNLKSFVDESFFIEKAEKAKKMLEKYPFPENLLNKKL